MARFILFQIVTAAKSGPPKPCSSNILAPMTERCGLSTGSRAYVVIILIVTKDETIASAIGHHFLIDIV